MLTIVPLSNAMPFSNQILTTNVNLPLRLALCNFVWINVQLELDQIECIK